MNITQHLLAFFRRFTFFSREQTPSALAQQALKRWREPARALSHLLRTKNPSVLTLEAGCVLWGQCALDHSTEHIHLLGDLLHRVPIADREHALRLATDDDPSRLTALLVHLAPAHLEGLTRLATALKKLWDQHRRADELAIAFYQVAPDYGCSLFEATASLVRIYMQKAEYQQAEAVLRSVFAAHPLPPSDLYWTYLSLQFHLRRSPEHYIDILEYFIHWYPTDYRLGQAWQRLGDLYGYQVQNYEKALDAYQKAEDLGMQVRQLQEYRAGNWQTLPALRQHPSAAFPTVVVIDLEVDPQPEAPPGSRVFEVAAVRYKGPTSLEEYHSYIHRDFSPAKWSRETAEARLRSAPAVETVARQLRSFIGNAIVVGHNLQAFDAVELAGMGVPIAKEQILDTLLLARLLHPDSLHHHLGLLCRVYGIQVEEHSLHSALPDAKACARLFHALGESLVQREDGLLTGIRALVTPGSAFDRALLQPRQRPADPALSWELDPRPMRPRVLPRLRGEQPSAAMQQAIQRKGDCFVEHTDFDMGYARFLPVHQRTLVTVGSHTRIERLLAGAISPEQLFVLPHPDTLLCPDRLRKAIAASTDDEQRLALFCLYQASHNHDAATLYPLRLPTEAYDHPALRSLKQTLLKACCASEQGHPADCPAREAVQQAIASHPLLVGTHHTLLARQIATPQAGTIVLDDLADLQMHLAEESAETLTSRQVDLLLSTPAEQQVARHLEETLLAFAGAYLPEGPGYRERLPISSLLSYLEEQGPLADHPLFVSLGQVSEAGKQLANILRSYLARSRQAAASPEHCHAFWIDLWFAGGSNGPVTLQQWTMYGLSQDLRTSFQERCWKPYKHHLLAGSALSVGAGNTEFFERSLGIPPGLPSHRDARPRKRVLLPSPELMAPPGFLQRRRWLMDMGRLIASCMQGSQRSILVSVNQRLAADAFLEAFQKTGERAKRQVLASQLGWTTAKIGERLRDPERSVLVFASPRLRQGVLAEPVELEISGPLRFLNQRDPVVAAQIQVFGHRYPKEGYFQAYLLPQALLELKARLTSEAGEVLICDSSLLTKAYRDEVLQLLHEEADIRELTTLAHPVSERLMQALKQALERRGLSTQVDISDRDLHLVLRSIWDTETFRTFSPLEPGSPPITQKEIVRAALNKKDQLVIAATGGGKSLCFQLPALLLAEEAIPQVTLVFSPLIALMSNQVEQLNRKGIFSAIVLNSTLSPEQRQEYLRGIKKGVYSIIYLAPEQIFSSALRDVLQHREIGLIAIDEAHCISQWGHNFRTDYFLLKKWISRTLCRGRPREFPILALTATARKGYHDPHQQEDSDRASTVTDIIEKLGLRLSVDEVIMSSPIRPELAFHFEYITPTYTCPKCRHAYEYQLAVGACPHCDYRPHVESRQIEQDVTELKKQRLLALLGPESPTSTSLPHLYPRWSRPLGERQRGLIYCAYRKTVEEVAAYLQARIAGLRVGAYHAGMEMGERSEVLRRFTGDEGDGLDVVVATNAFGMGVDVRRLGFVIHFDTPGTPEAYYQEAGRAGRDRIFQEGREQATCILLFHPADLEKQRRLSSQNLFSDYEIEDIYQAICEIYKRDEERPSTQSLQLDSTPFLPASPDALRVYVSTQELAMRAGVEEESVHTLLYYLEEQTRDRNHHQLVLERGVEMNHLWQVKFERDYQEKLRHVPASSPSRPLLRAFLEVDDYRLTTQHWTTFAARDLADSLHCSLKTLEQELLNLLKRGIIMRQGSGQFWLNYPLETLIDRLTDIERVLKRLFQTMNRNSGNRLERNEGVTVNLHALLSQQMTSTISLPQLTTFLFRFSLETAEPERLLERFHRVIRFGQPDRYELQCWSGRKAETIYTIIEQLRQTVAMLASHMHDQTNYRDWHRLDLFDPDLNYSYWQRQKFHQQLFVLQALGLLKYSSDPALGKVMELILLQPPVPLDQLEVDLGSLRLQEKHGKSKRKLMEKYATLSSKEEYARYFAQYFQGARPLLAQSQHDLRSDLTPQQRQIALLKGGIHVVQGPAGCGKTTVLAEHVKFLVNQQVPLDHILITTHYRSAEGHIAEALKELDSEGDTTVSTTINAFGNKIFQQYRHLLLKPDSIPYYGQAQELHILQDREEEEEESAAIKAALQKLAGCDIPALMRQERWPWTQKLEIPAFPQRYRQNAVVEGQFRDAIHRLRWYGIFPTQPPTGDDLVQILGERTGEYTLAEYYAVYLVFTQIMAERHQYTFEDQIVFALAILRKNPELLHAYQRYFEHIIIDELQDFSPAKVELLLLVCQRHTNILAFGDVEQEVGFDKAIKSRNDSRAGAAISAAQAFARLAEQESCGPNRTHQLLVNFRSTQEILDFTASLRGNGRKGAVRRLQSGMNKHGPKPVYLYTITNTLKDLLDGALDQIERLSPPEKESVVLIFGNKELLQKAQNSLRERNMPFSLMDGQKALYQVHYVKNLLLYLELILDQQRDEEVERLLRYNLVPYLDKAQIASLKLLAGKHACSLFEVIASPKDLQKAKISKEQQERIRQHVQLITQHRPQDRVSQLKQALDDLPDGPLTLLQEQKEKRKDVEDILNELGNRTIQQAHEEIMRHILFLDTHRGRSDLVLTTVEHSKSQEFETVLVLGVGSVRANRLYVSASRARQRLFFVGDEAAFEENRALSRMPNHLYTGVSVSEIAPAQRRR